MVNFEISSDFLKVLVENTKISPKIFKNPGRFKNSPSFNNNSVKIGIFWKITINCRFNSIPQNIEGRIMEFMVTTWQQTKGIDTNAVVNLCPKDLKADICVHLHR